MDWIIFTMLFSAILTHGMNWMISTMSMSSMFRFIFWYVFNTCDQLDFHQTQLGNPAQRDICPTYWEILDNRHFWLVLHYKPPVYNTDCWNCDDEHILDDEDCKKIMNHEMLQWVSHPLNLNSHHFTFQNLNILSCFTMWWSRICYENKMMNVNQPIKWFTCTIVTSDFTIWCKSC